MSGPPAQAAVSASPVDLAIGGVSVRVGCADPDLTLNARGASRLFLSHGGDPDVDLTVRRAHLRPAEDGACVFDSGGVWRLFGEGPTLVFRLYVPHHGNQPLKEGRISPDFASGEILFHDEVFPPGAEVDPLDHPLDELVVAGFLATRSGVILHACGVSDDKGDGILFSGFSGDGKTTTAQLWEQLSGVTVLSDDRIIVRPGTGCGFTMYGTPWHGEARLSSTARARLRAIFVLEHGEQNQLLPIGPVEAAALLAARSFPPLFSASGMTSVLGFLASIAAGVPCYRFRFRPDQSAVSVVRAALGAIADD